MTSTVLSTHTIDTPHCRIQIELSHPDDLGRPVATTLYIYPTPPSDPDAGCAPIVIRLTDSTDPSITLG